MARRDARAPGADWGNPDRESAVLPSTLDGPGDQTRAVHGAKALTYKVALGRVRAGRPYGARPLDRAKSPVKRAGSGS